MSGANDPLNGFLHDVAVDFARHAEGDREVVRANEYGGHTVQSCDLLNLIERFLCFALWNDERFAVANVEIVRCVRRKGILPVSGGAGHCKSA
ncbi:hypothetical protein SDC9_77371 [bioreactor metagenome]|uniref:Uncharacterized protein n=1 Tax=bioreactor metagenome TaxID=1076179 RepID=A0A644YSI2_9ZZZZ